MQEEDINVFTYGSLMFPRIMEALVMKSYPQTHATLYNYMRKAVKNAIYPGIIPCQGHKVDGTVYYKISNEHLQVLHKFEDTDGDNYEARNIEL